MASSATPAKHPHEKHGQILADLRGKIVSGKWPAGTRLPIRPELAYEYKTTVVTVQKALHRLIDDGFVVSRGRIGSFVADVLPHLSHYAMAFPSRQHHAGWTHLHDIFHKLGVSLEAQSKGPAWRKIPQYFGVAGDASPAPCPLVQDALARKLAGIVFVGPSPGPVSQLLDNPDIFFSAFAGNPPHPRVPVACTDVNSFIARAVERLAEKKCKSVAVITTATSRNITAEFRDHLPALITAKGMLIKPHWMIPVHPSTPQGARVAIQILFDCDARHRPDAIIIADDHLVEESAAGLIAAGVRVPEDVEVIAHCNYPYLPACVLPVTWLGFDLRRVLRGCLDLIDQQRSGQRVPPVTMVGAVFADEVEPMTED